MNKQQNYSQKKDRERIKTLEIENALLRQKLETISHIANFDKKEVDIIEIKEKAEQEKDHDRDNSNN